MIKAITYSFKKSKRLKKISNLLGIAAALDPSDLSEYLVIKTNGEREEQKKAEEELLDLCESDPYLAKVIDKYKADRETLRKAYVKLILAGVGQWKKGHYVPASSLVYVQTLDYLLRNLDKEEKDFAHVAWRLLKYFEKGRIWIKEEK